MPGYGWTLKKLCRWLGKQLGKVVCRGTLRKVLRAAKLSWKKCKKLLGKANPQKRAEYLQSFLTLYQRVCTREVLLIYVDESHFHRDLDLGYTWGPVGQRCWRVSDNPRLGEKIHWYGAYNFSDGQCLIWHQGRCNGEQTVAFLRQIAEWIDAQGREVVIVWDGAPWHKGQKVRDTAKQLGFELILLPGYSPDFNPIEGLWKWMREEVTQHFCHDSLQALYEDCMKFIQTINEDPLAMIDRLWPKFDLDPEVEKLRISK